MLGFKSIRGSDPDAAIYWLARMLESGEDPRFIARRLVILSSEDVGNADPQAILVANAAWQSRIARRAAYAQRLHPRLKERLRQLPIPELVEV